MTHTPGTILQRDGTPYKPAVRELATPLDTDLPSSERRAVAQAVSPAYLRSIEDSANKGRPRDLINFAETAREKDDRLAICAGRREGAVASLDWSVQPGRLGPDATENQKDRALEIAGIATGVLERIEYCPIPDTGIGAGAFSDLLRHYESSIYYAVAPVWWLWDYVDGRWDPVQANWVHPRRIAWDGNLHPRLYDPGAPGPSGQYPGMELDPLRWTVDLGQVRPGYPMRDGYARAAIWLYAYTSFAWKDFVQYSEQFGAPFLIGYVNGGPNAESGSSDQDKDRQLALQRIVKGFNGLRRAVIDGRDDIKALQVSANAKHIAPIELIRLGNEAKAILLLGATQAVDVGDHATQATSKTHEGVELRLVQHDAEHRSNTISGFLKQWYELNFDDGPEYRPRFWLDAEEPADIDAEIKKQRHAYDLGVELSKAEVRESLGLQPPQEDPKTGEPAEDDVVSKPEAPDPFGGVGEFGRRVMSAGRVLGAKPEDLGPEDLGGETWEEATAETHQGHVDEYAKVANQAAEAARSEALDVATTWIKDQSTDPGVSSFAEGLYDALSPAYRKTMAQGKFKPVVEAIYENFKLDTAGWPKGLTFDFSGTDILFSETLGEVDTVYLSSYIENDGSQRAIKSFLKEWYGEKGGDLFGKRTKLDTLDDLRKALGGKIDHLHDWQVRRIINTSVARTRGYAELKQMHDAVVEEMEWYANRTERTCGICSRLHGTVVRVSKVYEHAVAEMELGADAFIDNLKARHEAHPITPDILDGLDDEGRARLFEVAGHQIPVHPNCACQWLARILGLS